MRVLTYVLLLIAVFLLPSRLTYAWSPSDPPVSNGTFGSSVSNYGQIAIDSSGRVYVTGGGNGNDVEQLDSNGNHLRYFGPLNSSGVAVDTDGNILVLDWDADINVDPSVLKFDPSGNPIDISGTDLGGTARLEFAYSAAVDSQGNVYISDWQGNGDADPVYKYDADGDYVATITANGGSFDQITSIAVDGSDNLYVLDGNNARLQKFDSDGDFVMQVTGNGGAWSFPEGFTVDATGNIYVSDSGNERIQIFNSSGVFQQELDAADFGVGSFSYIAGLAITEDGKLYVGDDTRILTAQFDRTADAPSITAFSGNRTDDSTPSIAGTATDSYSAITNVEFSVDSGSYAACTADDGSFNETSEAYTCTVAAALNPGSHTVQIRATDGNTNTGSGSTIASYTFCFGGSNCEIPVTSTDSSVYKVPECTDAKPETPNLFRVDVVGTSAILYFAPIAGSTNYAVDYLVNGTSVRYGTMTGPQQTNGVVAYGINDLAAQTPYVFRVMAKHGCRPGEWSDTISVITSAHTSVSTKTFGTE